MKGNIKPGDKIFKIESKELSDSAKVTFSGKEFKKIKLFCKVSVKRGVPVSVSITPDKEFECYSGLSVNMKSSIIPEDAIKQPLTVEKVVNQFSKTNNTPFEFSKIDVVLDDNLYIPKVSELNALRRSALDKFVFLINRKFTRVPVSIKPRHFKDKSHSGVKIALMLLELNTDFDYTKVDDVDRVYIPLRCFRDINNKKILADVCSKFDVYVCLPMVINLNYSNLLDSYISDIVSNYPIKGFLFSSLGELSVMSKYPELDAVMNYNLNVFNDYSASELERFKVSAITLSPELSKSDVNGLCSKVDKEFIVYGRLKLMTCRYCLIGGSNRLLSYLQV